MLLCVILALQSRLTRELEPKPFVALVSHLSVFQNAAMLTKGSYPSSRIFAARSHVSCLSERFKARPQAHSCNRDTDMMDGYDYRADFWALGILMFEMLTGYTPFYSEDKFDKFEKIKTAEFKFPRRGISNDARDLLSRLLAREASQRLGTQGIAEIKAHPFFATVDWQALADRRITPPVKPDISFTDDESPNSTPGLVDGPFAASPVSASRRSSCASGSSESSVDDNVDWVSRLCVALQSLADMAMVIAAVARFQFFPSKQCWQSCFKLF